MDAIFSASIVASFLAGMVALFAPCCITILLPTYLAAAFREKKHILKMTFVFFAGIAAILVPVGLGAASLAHTIQRFHNALYLGGGLLMVVLSVMSVLGKNFTLIPLPQKLSQGLNVTHAKSVFLLGVLSGAATSCCAPVLAGALTLALISGAFWKAVIVTFAYIFGMTFPLFLIAYYFERFNVRESKLLRGKLLEIKLGAKIYFLHTTNLLAGVVFLVMGVLLTVLALSHNAFWSPNYQTKVSKWLNHISLVLLNKLVKIPNEIWGAIIILLFLYFIYQAVKFSRRSN